MRVLSRIVFALLLLVLSASVQALDKGFVNIKNAQGKNVRVDVEFARTNAERSFGLMKRESLGEYSGMLFVFPEEQYLTFWMKDVSFPLSIAYADSKGRILQIMDMKENNDRLTYPSMYPVKYALEVNRGFFAKHDIREGCMIDAGSWLKK